MPIIGPNEVNATSMNPDVKKMLTDLMTVQDGLTAFAGGGQASGTLVGAMFARFTTVATAADSGKLPPATQPGMELTIVNAAAANSMNLFPNTGDQINVLGANAAFALAANKCVKAICTARGQWHTILTA
jgi:hypothetical protein